MSIGILFPLDERQPLTMHDYGDLVDYQRAVGGYVESVGVGLDGVSFLAHDEAKLVGLGINRRATLFWWVNTAPARHRDYLAGDVVLVGPPDRERAALDVPREVQQVLFASTLGVDVAVSGSTKWHRNPEDFVDYFEAAYWALDLANRRREVEDVRVVLSE